MSQLVEGLLLFVVLPFGGVFVMLAAMAIEDHFLDRKPH